MKKLIIILFAAFSFTAVSAQNRNDNYNSQDRYRENQTIENRNFNDQHPSKEYAYSGNTGRITDRNRQEDYDHMNQQYDRKERGYINDRSLGKYERERRMHEPEQERHQKARYFGAGWW